MELNEIEVRKRYWWNGRFRNHGSEFVSPQEVTTTIIDEHDYAPIGIRDSHNELWYVHPETLSPLTEHEDAK